MSVSAIFYTPSTDGTSNVTTLWFPQSEHGSFDVFTINVLPDSIDPSLNFALARGFIERSSKGAISITTTEEYVKILNDEAALFQKTLYTINQSNTLINQFDQATGSQSKIIFLAVTQDLIESFNLQKVEITDLSSLTAPAQEFLKTNNVISYLHENLNKPKTIYCILNSEDLQGFKNLYEGLFQGIMQGENETWISVSLVDMTPIDEATFKSIKGFIVTGSHHDAYDTSMPWVPVAYQLLNRIIYPEQENEQKLIAICWGHQAIGNGCGGKASRMPHLEMYQIRDEIKFNQDVFIQNRGGESVNLAQLMPNPFYSVKCHGDYVYELARDAQLIASSSRVEIEGMAIRNKAITFQFHPEFNKTMLLKILSESSPQKQVNQSQLQKAIDSFEPNGNLSNQHLNLYLKKFLSS